MYLKVNSFKRIRNKPKIGRKYLQKMYLNKGLLSQMYITINKFKNPLKKWSKDLNRYLTKNDTQIRKKHLKRCFILCITRKMQIKPTVTYPYLSI